MPLKTVNHVVCLHNPSGVGSLLSEPGVTKLTVHKLGVSDQETSRKLCDYVELYFVMIVLSRSAFLFSS